MHGKTVVKIVWVGRNKPDRSDNIASEPMTQEHVTREQIEFISLLPVLSRLISTLNTIDLMAQPEYFPELCGGIDHLDREVSRAVGDAGPGDR